MTRRQPHGHPANSTKYKRLRAEFMRKQGRSGLCALCGGQVDMSLSGRTAFGPSVDHIQATSAGGDWFDPTNWQLAHLRCNNQKGRGVALGDGRGQRSAIPSSWSGYPVPGDPRYCWTKGSDGWSHIWPGHGEPDHWNCQWPGCRHGE